MRRAPPPLIQDSKPQPQRDMLQEEKERLSEPKRTPPEPRHAPPVAPKPKPNVAPKPKKIPRGPPSVDDNASLDRGSRGSLNDSFEDIPDRRSKIEKMHAVMTPLAAVMQKSLEQQKRHEDSEEDEKEPEHGHTDDENEVCMTVNDARRLPELTNTDRRCRTGSKYLFSYPSSSVDSILSNDFEEYVDQGSHSELEHKVGSLELLTKSAKKHSCYASLSKSAETLSDQNLSQNNNFEPNKADGIYAEIDDLKASNVKNSNQHTHIKKSEQGPIYGRRSELFTRNQKQKLNDSKDFNEGFVLETQNAAQNELTREFLNKQNNLPDFDSDLQAKVHKLPKKVSSTNIQTQRKPEQNAILVLSEPHIDFTDSVIETSDKQKDSKAILKEELKMYIITPEKINKTSPDCVAHCPRPIAQETSDVVDNNRIHLHESINSSNANVTSVKENFPSDIIKLKPDFPKSGVTKEKQEITLDAQTKLKDRNLKHIDGQRVTDKDFNSPIKKQDEFEQDNKDISPVTLKSEELFSDKEEIVCLNSPSENNPKSLYQFTFDTHSPDIIEIQENPLLDVKSQNEEGIYLLQSPITMEDIQKPFLLEQNSLSSHLATSDESLRVMHSLSFDSNQSVAEPNSPTEGKEQLISEERQNFKEDAHRDMKLKNNSSLKITENIGMIEPHIESSQTVCNTEERVKIHDPVLGEAPEHADTLVLNSNRNERIVKKLTFEEYDQELCKRTAKPTIESHDYIDNSFCPTKSSVPSVTTQDIEGRSLFEEKPMDFFVMPQSLKDFHSAKNTNISSIHPLVKETNLDTVFYGEKYNTEDDSTDMQTIEVEENRKDKVSLSSDNETIARGLEETDVRNKPLKTDGDFSTSSSSSIFEPYVNYNLNKKHSITPKYDASPPTSEHTEKSWNDFRDQPGVHLLKSDIKKAYKENQEKFSKTRKNKDFSFDSHKSGILGGVVSQSQSKPDKPEINCNKGHNEDTRCREWNTASCRSFYPSLKQRDNVHISPISVDATELKPLYKESHSSATSPGKFNAYLDAFATRHSYEVFGSPNSNSKTSEMKPKISPGVVHMVRPAPAGWIEGGLILPSAKNERNQSEGKQFVSVLDSKPFSTLSLMTNMEQEKDSKGKGNNIDEEQEQNESLPSEKVQTRIYAKSDYTFPNTQSTENKTTCMHTPVSELLCKRIWKYSPQMKHDKKFVVDVEDSSIAHAESYIINKPKSVVDLIENETRTTNSCVGTEYPQEVKETDRNLQSPYSTHDAEKQKRNLSETELYSSSQTHAEPHMEKGEPSLLETKDFVDDCGMKCQMLELDETGHECNETSVKIPTRENSILQQAPDTKFAPSDTDSDLSDTSGSEVEIVSFEMPKPCLQAMRCENEDLDTSFEDRGDEILEMADPVSLSGVVIDCSLEDVTSYKLHDSNITNKQICDNIHSTNNEYSEAVTHESAINYIDEDETFDELDHISTEDFSDTVPDILSTVQSVAQKSNLKMNRNTKTKPFNRKVHFQENLPVYKSKPNELFKTDTELTSVTDRDSNKIQTLERFIFGLFDEEPSTSSISDTFYTSGLDTTSLNSCIDGQYLNKSNNAVITTDLDEIDYYDEDDKSHVETEIKSTDTMGTHTNHRKDGAKIVKVVAGRKQKYMDKMDSFKESQDIQSDDEAFMSGISDHGRISKHGVKLEGQDNVFRSSMEQFTDFGLHLKSSEQNQQHQVCDGNERKFPLHLNDSDPNHYGDVSQLSMKADDESGKATSKELDKKGSFDQPVRKVNDNVTRYSYSYRDDSDPGSPKIKYITYEYVTEYKLNNVTIQYQQNKKVQTDVNFLPCPTGLTDQTDKPKVEKRPESLANVRTANKSVGSDSQLIDDNLNGEEVVEEIVEPFITKTFCIPLEKETPKTGSDGEIEIEEIMEQSVCYPLGPIVDVPSTHLRDWKEEIIEEHIRKSINYPLGKDDSNAGSTPNDLPKTSHQFEKADQDQPRKQDHYESKKYSFHCIQTSFGNCDRFPRYLPRLPKDIDRTKQKQNCGTVDLFHHVALAKDQRETIEKYIDSGKNTQVTEKGSRASDLKYFKDFHQFETRAQIDVDKENNVDDQIQNSLLFQNETLLSAIMQEELPSLLIVETTQERLFVVQVVAILAFGAVLVFLLPFVG